MILFYNGEGGLMHNKVFFAMVLAFGLLGMIRGLDYFMPGDVNYMLINVNNDGDEDLDDLKVSVFVYDLGVVLKTSQFDLDDHETAGKILYWDVPKDTEPGSYWARITVSNDDVRKVKHRLVTIV